MRFIKRVLLKLLGNDIYQPNPIEVKKMEDWLFKSFKDGGFTSYYTMRKKYLVNLLSLGVTGDEQQRALGRLEELKALSTNIKAEYTKRSKKLKD